MAKIIDKRVCAETGGRLRRLPDRHAGEQALEVWKWLPVAIAMPRMLIELAKHPELGLLHARTQFGFPNVMVIQYWKSFEELEAYAKARDLAHLPAWHAFNKAVGSNGDVGIWHETYVIEPGKYENIYNNMPPYGLGAARPSSTPSAAARPRGSG